VQIQRFAIGKYELTQEQWHAVMGSNPSANVGRTYPMEQVSWYDIQQFIGKLNEKTGRKYRLPSEAEWEYAAKAGTNTDWSFGNDESNLGSYAWYDANSRGKTHEVGQKQPNPFGLFDMHGNVWEWVEDCWHESYVGASTDGSAWATGCSGNYRVLRGGSALSFPQHGGASFRHKDSPESRALSMGFRLARDLSNNDAQPPAGLQGQSGTLQGGASAIEGAKQKCGDLGFELGTEGFGKCVLKLSK
jgi:formylglycine-generating enzyme required for sulfatase activity